MAFTVHIEPGGHGFDVQPGETILAAALRQGIPLPYGCRSGNCGACLGRVLAGEVDYGTEGEPPVLEDRGRTRDMAALCRARAASDLIIEVKAVAGAGEGRVRTLPALVVKKERLSADVMGVWLRLPPGECLSFRAGQYLDILLRDGRRRSFSIANGPRDDRLLELHIRHVAGGDFTGYIFERLREQDVLRIEGPHGDFFLREDSRRPMLLVAGGTGFAPVKAILERAFARDMPQPMSLYWGVRGEGDLYLEALPRRWQAARDNFRYLPVLSEPGEGWGGRTGLVHEAVLADLAERGEDLAAHDVYVCGPPAMVRAAFEAFRAHGLDEARFHSDAFEFQAPKAAAG